jgi:hypothetical protein
MLKVERVVHRDILMRMYPRKRLYVGVTAPGTRLSGTSFHREALGILAQDLVAR